MNKYKIKISKKQLMIMKKYWKTLQELDEIYKKEIYILEKEMSDDTGIKELEFYMCDNDYVGVGNIDRTMKLIHDIELEK